MRLKKNWAKVAAVAASATLLLAHADLVAQNAPKSVGEKAGPEKAASEVLFKRTSRLSGAEQLRQAQEYLRKMSSMLRRVERLARGARIEKDVIKLNCVNDKLIQIKGNLRVGEQSRDAIKVAESRNDVGTRDHEFSKLTIAYQRVVVLGQEAEACIGEEIAYVGTTRVDVQVDPEIPETDPTVEQPPPSPTIRPPVASPAS
ncbi:MAG: hypothetical protein H6707_01100 [Deltaproteobacteria bacterium]|nr:hypothetical protein [Deltaproteobacteria bacterium]